jgi:hypothetical protein
MKIRNILSLANLAFAGISFFTVSAYAGPSGANFAGDGDLTLQLRGSGSTAAISYVIDLGPILNYLPSSINGAPGQGTYSTGSLVNLSAAGGPAAGLYADITSAGVFGSSLTGVSWSLSAFADGSGNLRKNAFAISSPETTVGIAAPAIHNLSSSGANSTASSISTFQTNYQAAPANGATTATGEIQNSATFSPGGGDYAGNVSNGHVLTFPTATIENTFGSLNGTVSDLIMMNTTSSTSGNGIDVGAFGFDSAGNLYFDSKQAGFPVVPEPATAAMLASTLLGLFSFARRRRSFQG